MDPGRMPETRPDESKRDEGASETPSPEEHDDGTRESKPTRKRRWILVLGALLLAGAAAFAVFYILNAAKYESTDDAFIDGHITRVAPRVSGQVRAVHVEDNQLVKQGDLLVEIDPADYQVALERTQADLDVARARHAQARAARSAAEARVSQAQADLGVATTHANLAGLDLRRARQLIDSGAAPQQELDDAQAAAAAAEASVAAAKQHVAATRASAVQAQSEVAAAEADVKQAEAAVDTAKLNLSYTKVRAQMDGRVTKKNVEPGDYLQPGEQVLALVELHVWVTANFKETQLADMRPGQPVTLSVDAYSKEWKGRVDSLQQGTGARFSLLPPENATGNYVKVVQRVPVKLVFDELPDPHRYLLAPGMSVVPTVMTTTLRDTPMVPSVSGPQPTPPRLSVK